MNEHQEIIDYLTSTSDIPADLLKAIQQWLIEHGGEAATTGALFSVWDNMGNDNGRTSVDPDIAKGLQRILHDIDSSRTDAALSSSHSAIPLSEEPYIADTPSIECSIKPVDEKPAFTKWLFIAASICVIFSVGSFLLGNMMARHSSDTVLLAAEGSIGKYTLPDGTRLWLNGGSTLTYNSDFDDSAERRVSIDGEAYFEVTRNPRRPFIVEMESMDVKVLGTSFSTRSYPYSGAEEVILLSGKVELNSPLLPDALIMRPDQKVTLDRVARQAVVEPANARTYCRWIEPVTTFDNEPLGDILILLSRRYGLDISVNDSAQVDTRMSITLNSSQSLDEVISIIEHIIPVKITADGNSLTLASAKAG